MKKLLILGLLLLLPTQAFAGEKRTFPREGITAFGGIDDTSNITTVKDNRASDIQNMVLDVDGSISSRYGYSLKIGTLDTNATTDNFEAITSIYELRKSDGNNYFITTCGDKIFYDNSGTWTDITGGAVTITEGQNYQFTWTTALDYAIGTNFQDQPIQWNGTGNAEAVDFTDLTDAITKANCVTWWKNYLIFGNIEEGGSSYTTRIRWSNIGTIDTFSDEDYIDIATNAGQDIEGFGILYDNLFIFMTNSIFKLTYVAGDNVFTVTRVSEGRGCVAKNSIQNILVNNIESLVFLSKDATINQFTGTAINEISILIQGVLGNAKPSRLQYAVSADDQTNNHYYLSLTNTEASTTNNLLLDYFYKTGEWSKYEGVNANAMGIADDADDMPQVYFGNYDSFVYELNDTDTVNDVWG